MSSQPLILSKGTLKDIQSVADQTSERLISRLTGEFSYTVSLQRESAEGPSIYIVRIVSPEFVIHKPADRLIGGRKKDSSRRKPDVYVVKADKPKFVVLSKSELYDSPLDLDPIPRPNGSKSVDSESPSPIRSSSKSVDSESPSPSNSISSLRPNFSRPKDDSTPCIVEPGAKQKKGSPRTRLFSNPDPDLGADVSPCDVLGAKRKREVNIVHISTGLNLLKKSSADHTDRPIGCKPEPDDIKSSLIKIVNRHRLNPNDTTRPKVEDPEPRPKRRKEPDCDFLDNADDAADAEAEGADSDESDTDSPHKTSTPFPLPNSKPPLSPRSLISRYILIKREPLDNHNGSELAVSKSDKSPFVEPDSKSVTIFKPIDISSRLNFNGTKAGDPKPRPESSKEGDPSPSAGPDLVPKSITQIPSKLKQVPEANDSKPGPSDTDSTMHNCIKREPSPLAGLGPSSCTRIQIKSRVKQDPDPNSSGESDLDFHDDSDDAADQGTDSDYSDTESAMDDSAEESPQKTPRGRLPSSISSLLCSLPKSSRALIPLPTYLPCPLPGIKARLLPPPKKGTSLTSPSSAMPEGLTYLLKSNQHFPMSRSETCELPMPTRSSKTCPSPPNPKNPPKPETPLKPKKPPKAPLPPPPSLPPPPPPSLQTVHVDWLPAEFILTDDAEEYLSGYVRTEEEAQAVLTAHAKFTESHLNIVTDNLMIKNKTTARKRLFSYNRYMQISSHLTSNDRLRIYKCIFRLRKKRNKKLNKLKGQEPPENETMCPASIFIYDITAYKDYMIYGLPRRDRQKLGKSLDNALAQNLEVNCEKFVYLRLPLKNAHRGHLVCEGLWRANKTHPKLLKKIKDLAECGLRDVNVIREVCKKYAEEELMDGNPRVRGSRYFCPTTKTIKRRINSANVKYGLIKPRKTKKNEKSVKSPKKKKKKKINEEEEEVVYQYNNYGI